MILLLKNHAGRFAVCSILMLLFLSVSAGARTHTLAESNPQVLNKKLSLSALTFTENKGQVAGIAGNARPDVLFTARSGNMNLFLTATGISYQFKKITYPESFTTDPEKQAELEKQAQTQMYNFSLSLEGANPHPNVIKEGKSAAVQNFYLAQCPDGIINTASYSKLVYEDVYPNINWVVYSHNNHLKYDFIVKPGGDPAMIKLKIKDAESVSVTKEGELLMTTSLGEIREKAPLSYIEGSLVKSAFRKNADGTVGFDVAAPQGKELRIDPSVVWATYFGGSLADMGYSCATDANKNIYLAGVTASVSAIANGGLQTSNGGGNDAFLAKFDSSGYLLWSTYYGGSGSDIGLRCATDATGNVYLTGSTTTPTGIANGGSQSANGGGTDAFLVKFDPSGARLWATYYGGTGTDNPVTGYQGICTDASGNVYMAGNTSSTTGIFSGGFQSTPSNGFLVKFDASGNRIWGTYYNGSGNACTADASGNVYLVGQVATGAANVASGGFQNAGGGSTDAYLVKFDASGNRVWGTFYGGTLADIGASAVADASGNVYLAGQTSSANNIFSGGFQSTLGGGSDGFLVKFDASGNRLWGTYYGGSSTEQSTQCILDNSGNVYLSGVTASPNGIASNGYQNTSGGGQDAFLAKISPAGTLLWGTYYGGTGAEIGFSCAANASGDVYLAGQTASSAGIALPGTYQSAIGGGTDAFLVKIGDLGLFTGSLISNALCAGSTVKVPYTLFGTYNSGNVFTAQLSDSSGSFASPVNIGTLTSTTADTIIATIPLSALAGVHYRIRVIANNPGIIGTNNGTSITINPSVATSVSIAAAPGNNICSGTSVTFTPTPNNGGTTPAYTWIKNGTTVGTGSTYTNNALVNNDTVYVYMTSSAACALPATDTSNKILMTVGAPATPSVTITANPGNTICAGTSVTFTPTPVNGGTPAYTWKKNGNTVGTGTTYTDNALVAGDVITVTMTSNANCTSTTPVTSNSITMTVTPLATPSVTIAANPGNTICAGTPVTFTPTPVNGGTPVYVWKKNGNTVGTSTTYTDNALVTGDVITVTMTSNANCTSTTPVASNSITMTVNPVVTPSVTIAANPGNTICAGTSVIFTPTPANGGTPTYVWKKNGNTVGTSSTYTDNTLVTGDVITVIMTSSANCTSVNPVTSNSITMTVNPVVTPSVTIAAIPGNTICAGTSVTFTPTPVNGGTPTYVWKKNGNTVGTSSTYTDNTLVTGDVITVIMTSSANCTSVNPVTSNSITMTVNPMVTPSVTIAANPGNTICSGTSVTFTPTPVNGGTPTYVWKKNGNTVSTNTTYTDNTLATGDVITATMTSSAGCTSVNPVTSNSITMTVNASVTPSVTIAANPGNTICSGTSVTFTPTPVNGGTPTYVWKKNGTTVGAGATYTDNGLANGDVITVTMTSSANCTSVNPITSNSITMTVNPSVAPTVTILGGTLVCGSASDTLTAIYTNGGSTPAFQWKKNGVNISNAGSVYIATGLVSGDVISVTVSSNAPCVVPSSATTSVIVTVTPPVTPAVTIASNAGNSICAGTVVTFTATPVNGGTTPAYQWKSNGVNVGSNSNVYSGTGMANGDVITVVMTSNATCAIPPAVTANSITMTVNPVVTPSVTISANPADTVCTGTQVTFTAVPVNGGTTPSYQWQKNGLNTGFNSTSYIDNTLVTGDAISVILTSNAVCVTNANTSSNIINNIVVHNCCDTPANVVFNNISQSSTTFSWNPVNGIAGYQYSVTQDTVPPATGSFTTSTTNSVTNLAPGTYYLYVRTHCGNGVYSDWIKVPFTVVPTGINNVPGDDFSLVVYPNPVSDIALIKVNHMQAAKATLVLTDISGKMINTGTMTGNTATVNMKGLTSGIYLLRYNDGLHTEIIKVNKQ